MANQNTPIMLIRTPTTLPIFTIPTTTTQTTRPEPQNETTAVVKIERDDEDEIKNPDTSYENNLYKSLVHQVKNSQTTKTPQPDTQKCLVCKSSNRPEFRKWHERNGHAEHLVVRHEQGNRYIPVNYNKKIRKVQKNIPMNCNCSITESKLGLAVTHKINCRFRRIFLMHNFLNQVEHRSTQTAPEDTQQQD